MTALTTADLPVTDPTATPHDHPRPSATLGTSTESNTTTDANRWLTSHYAEIVQRARFRHGHLDPEARDEAIAETLAYTTQAVHGAAGRGTLDRLTPWTCVRFAGKHIEQGRRTAGSSSRCVLSRECQQRHGIHTHSLDADQATLPTEMRIPTSISMKPSPTPRPINPSTPSAAGWISPGSSIAKK